LQRFHNAEADARLASGGFDCHDLTFSFAEATCDVSDLDLVNMIKKLMLLVTIAVASVTLGTAVQAAGISVEIGDRPYYSHGPRYWSGEWEMVWVPGHWSEGHHWVHGHYRRGEHRHHHDDRVREDVRIEERR